VYLCVYRTFCAENQLKGAVNPNFLNLTKIEKNFGFRNVLVPFLDSAKKL